MAWKSGPGIFLGEEQQKNDGKRPQERTEGILGGREKGRISHEPEMHWNRYWRHDPVKLGMFEQDGTLLGEVGDPHEKGKRRGAYPGGYCGGHKEKGSGKGTFDGRF